MTALRELKESVRLKVRVCVCPFVVTSTTELVKLALKLHIISTLKRIQCLNKSLEVWTPVDVNDWRQ